MNKIIINENTPGLIICYDNGIEQPEKIYYKLDENFYRSNSLLFSDSCLEIKVPLVCDSIICEELIAEKFIKCSYLYSSKRLSLNDTLICDTIITDYITYANTIIAKDIKTKIYFCKFCYS